jgi:hypothetical protein
MRTTTVAAALASALALASCVADTGDRGSGEPIAAGICAPVDPALGYAVRDTAGVRIIENLVGAAARGRPHRRRGRPHARGPRARAGRRIPAPVRIWTADT